MPTLDEEAGEAGGGEVVAFGLVIPAESGGETAMTSVNEEIPPTGTTEVGSAIEIATATARGIEIVIAIVSGTETVRGIETATGSGANAILIGPAAHPLEDPDLHHCATSVISHHWA